MTAETKKFFDRKLVARFRKGETLNRAELEAVRYSCGNLGTLQLFASADMAVLPTLAAVATGNVPLFVAGGAAALYFAHRADQNAKLGRASEAALAKLPAPAPKI
jgi:hypothetical protein